MDKYIYINYAYEDQEQVLEIVRRLKTMGMNVCYGSGSEEKVAGSCFVVHFCTKAAHTSRSYRKVMNYTLKHELDCMLFHLEGRTVVSDVEMQLDVLHTLFKFKYERAAAAVVTAAQAGQQEDRHQIIQPAEAWTEQIHSGAAAEAAEKQPESAAQARAAEEKQPESTAQTRAAEEKQPESAAQTRTAEAAEKQPESTAQTRVTEEKQAESTAQTRVTEEKQAESMAQARTAEAAKKQTETGERQPGKIADDAPARRSAEDPKMAGREALFLEGRRWLTGDGCDVNVEKAFGCFRQAASQGHVEAQYQLSVCYDRGIGVRRSISEAAKWCQMAAYGGHSQAQSEIGYCYEYGQGVVRNIKEAVRWYEIASEQGNMEAKNNLAFCYQKGKGVAKDVRRAIRLYEEAADAGHASAQYNLGFCYWYGEGIKADKEKAIDLFRQSAEGGNAKAGQMLKILNQHAFMRK